MTEFTIAVVEDDPDVLDNVCNYLEKAGFHAWGVGSAEDFYVRLLRDTVDLVVVDLGLPGGEERLGGLDLVRRLSKQGVPVIIQTAHGRLRDRISGLKAGALQCFVKPTDMAELVAGIRSLLRHVGAREAHGAELVQWRLDASAATLTAPNQCTVRLTSRELEFMSCLVADEGSLVSKAALLAAMELSDVEGGFHRIEVLLSRLRRKTLETTRMPLPVRAVFGRGLVFIA